tara:strand:+ start:496 stop:714 length:219 start_codon:yes stop_codon:yes gene_type:complete
MNNAQAIKCIRLSRKRNGLDCKITRIGTGKQYTIGLYGSDARRCADFVIRHGLAETPMSGTGSRHNPITVTA